MNALSITALRQEGKHEEALVLALQIASTNSSDAEIQFEAACVHDYLGREAEAVPFYVLALAGNLPPDKRLRALVGLGSTYRTLGIYAEAKETLTVAVRDFPSAHEAKIFLAMTLHNTGASKAAVELLLQVLAETSEDAGVKAYRRAIEFYAQDIERTWP